ncbi:integration host factor subunit beta [bacterium]|nr:integration host factor subunit beta [bacterium]
MTKRDIATQVAEKTGVTQLVVQKVIQETLDYVVQSLSEGRNIELRNFGVFKVKVRQGRIGRNPRTGEEVPIPPKKVVVFKPGKVMKDRVI